MSALLEVRDLRKEFPIRSGPWRSRHGAAVAVAGVDLDVDAGETVALVGESGSGKSTLARSALRLIEPTSGSVRFRGEELGRLSARELRRRRRHFQFVFQDPRGALDPRIRIGESVTEPLVVHRLAPADQRKQQALRLLDEVGLAAETADRYPHELSGGQRQRVGIARALASEPDLLVADEPVSALDLSVRAQVVNLLVGLGERRRLAMLFIAHDLALVDSFADRVVVLYLGRVVEEARTEDLVTTPLHPYTATLLAAVASLRSAPQRRAGGELRGAAPSSPARAEGCPCQPYCPIARERCRNERPELRAVADGRRVACHFPGELEGPARASGWNLSHFAT